MYRLLVSKLKKLILSIRPKFPTKQIEEDYQRLRETMVKDFKVCMIFLMLLNSLNITSAGVSNKPLELYIYSGTILISIVALCIQRCFGKWFEKYVHVITLLICVLYNITRISVTYSFLSYKARSRFFFSGYGLADLQGILLLRLVKISHKMYGMIIGLILRFVIICAIIEPGSFDVLLFLRHLLMDSFIVYTIWIQDSILRKVYTNFVQKKDELLKFKELLADYLPQSLIVVDCVLNSALFYNKAFQVTFGVDKSDSFLPKKVIKLDFSSLIVEKSTIRETGNAKISLNCLERSQPFISLEEVLEMFKSKCFFHIKTISLAASSTQEDQRKLFEVTIQKVKWDSEDAIAIMLNDITYQENLIALKHANTNKDKVIATVSHELRTPLNGIIGIIDIAEKKVDDPEVADYLSLCKDNAYLLLSLVNSILDLQQISAGKLKLNPTSIDIRKVMKSISKLFYFQCKQKNIYLEADVDKDVPEIISTDENRLKQILINLVGNALKFTQKGGIKLQVNPHPMLLNSLQISVSDSGIGIMKEDHKHLFKMYSKIENGESVNKNGVGLGLTISNALAKLLSGYEENAGIAVESEYGMGTKFSFTIHTNLEDLKQLHKTETELDLHRTRTMTISSNEPEDDTAKGLLTRKIEICEEQNINEDGEDHLKDHKQSDYDEFFAPNNLHAKISSYASLKRISTFNQPDACYKNSSQSKTTSLPMLETKTVQAHLKNQELKIQKDSLEVKGVETRVLIVDDNPFNLLVAKNLLKELKCITTTALSGLEAIEIIQKTTSEGLVFKAIFMDCQMPITDGFETTKILLEMMKNREIPEVPIYAWTANNSEEDVKRCYEIGMTGHLSKPASKADILKVISKLK